jgi:hypothetical protein
MSRHLPRLAVVAGAVLAVLWVVAVLDASEPGQGTILLFLGVTVAVGTVVAMRVPANPIGWLLLATAGFFLVQAPVGALGERMLESHPTVAAWLLWFGAERDDTWTWFPALWLLFTQVLLHFPDGKLPSAGWRVFRWFTWATLVYGTLVLAAIQTDVWPGVPSPVGLLSSDNPLVLVALLALLVCVLGSALSLVRRYRQASGTVREQITWVTFAVVLVIGVYAVSLTSVLFSLEAPWFWSVVSMSYSLIPLSIGVAVLKYRLFDIDRIVSRTVAYAVVTAAVLGVYALVVTSVARLLPASSALSVALATLAAAAAFRPLLARVQRRVDRRFDRARFDALREAEAFADRLSSTVDPDLVTADLHAVLDRTLAPTSVGTWTVGEAVAQRDPSASSHPAGPARRKPSP